MSRNIKKPEIVAKSAFYLNSTKEVLNNTIDKVLTWQLFLLQLNKSKIQIGLKKCLIFKHF